MESNCESAKSVAVASTILQKNSVWRFALLLGTLLCVAVVPARSQQKTPPSAPKEPAPGTRLEAFTSPMLAISPDGSRIVYVAANERGDRQLYVRSTGQKVGTPIPNTDGAENPVFSPDGEWVAFFVNGKKLQKAPVSGGPATTLCEIIQPRGLSWGTNDAIVFTPALSNGLMRISTSGGTPQPLTKLKEERSHRWPELLPDGKTVLFAIPDGTNGGEAQLVAERLETGQRRVLVQQGTQPHFASGRFLYVHANTLMAAPFDPVRLEFTGPIQEVVDQIQLGTRTGAANYSVSANGKLAYLKDRGDAGKNTLVWVGRDGAATPIPAPPRPYEHVRISPEGKRVLYSTPDMTTSIYDIDRRQFIEIDGGGHEQFPIWSPDGKRVAFLSNRSDSHNVWWMSADGTGPAEQLTYSNNLTEPSGWSSDGRLLLVVEQAPETNRNILVVKTNAKEDGKYAASMYLQTRVEEAAARFSPDGHWIVYFSNETGQNEIYVKAFPSTAERWKISTDGGSEPLWSPDGKEIVYRNKDKVMSVAVDTATGFSAGKPRMLFEGNYRHGVTFRPDYDISPDGKRFLMVQGSERPPSADQITLLPDWAKTPSRAR